MIEPAGEMWEPVPGYENTYRVSDLGRIQGLISGRILKPGLHSGGYLNVTLYKNTGKKMTYVHRVVAMTFIPNPDNKPEVNHKDMDRRNNASSNLEWVTKSENHQHAYRNGRKPRAKYRVHCVELGISTLGTPAMQEELRLRGFNAFYTAIHNVMKHGGRHCGFTFTYELLHTAMKVSGAPENVTEETA